MKNQREKIIISALLLLAFLPTKAEEKRYENWKVDIELEQKHTKSTNDCDADDDDDDQVWKLFFSIKISMCSGSIQFITIDFDIPVRRRVMVGCVSEEWRKIITNSEDDHTRASTKKSVNTH